MIILYEREDGGNIFEPEFLPRLPAAMENDFVADERFGDFILRAPSQGSSPGDITGVLSLWHYNWAALDSRFAGLDPIAIAGVFLDIPTFVSRSNAGTNLSTTSEPSESDLENTLLGLRATMFSKVWVHN